MGWAWIGAETKPEFCGYTGVVGLGFHPDCCCGSCCCWYPGDAPAPYPPYPVFVWGWVKAAPDPEGFNHEVYGPALSAGLSPELMSGKRVSAFDGWSMNGLLESSGGGEP